VGTVDIQSGLPALVLRWVARVWSIASIVLVGLFFVGEPFNPRGGEWLGLIFFPLGVCLGMVAAWWKESLGGFVTVASLAAFYGVNWATVGRLPAGWAFLAFAAPGFLFVASWIVSRRRGNTRWSAADGSGGPGE
jgi:hypothetical protein